MSNKIEKRFLKIQDMILDDLLSLESQKNRGLIVDNWKSRIGKGKTCVVENGSVFEKAVVTFSSVSGKNLPTSSGMYEKINKTHKFKAMGVSVICHPVNPKAPTSHFNVRTFIIFDKKGLQNWWIGGGCDLTPFLPYKSDITFWHRSLKSMFDPFNKTFYRKFAKECDKYFFLPHRKERRGVGGVFFDNLKYKDHADSLNLLECLGTEYIQTYSKILKRRASEKYSKDQKLFQQIRRGRYAEFNLLHDRGTKFGLDSGGRVKSILSSMPPSTSWTYEMPKELKRYETKLLKTLKESWVI